MLFLVIYFRRAAAVAYWGYIGRMLVESTQGEKENK